jgi:hypothetical protein
MYVGRKDDGKTKRGGRYKKKDNIQRENGRLKG